MRSPTKKATVLAALCALAAVLSYLEGIVGSVLPLPVPGLRLGLSNIALMAAAVLYGASSAYLCALVKCLLVFLLVGSPFSFLLSFSGTLLSLSVFLLLRCGKENRVGLIGASVASSACHVTGQVVAASVLMKTSLLTTYLPPLLFCAIPTGCVTAFLLSVILKRWEARL